MNFDPPHITNIKQVLPVVKDNPAFIVKDKGWYTVIDYMYMSDKLFHDPIERECRGIKFCSTTGKILARPYHKFHNLGERAAFATENVDLRQPHVVLDKLDGSMVHTCASTLGIYLMTRMGHTEVAQQAEKYLEANQIKYSHLFNSLSVDDYTYIFEYVGPSNKIVLDYEKEDLILTAIRHNQNGTYLFHDELVKLGKAFNVPVVGHYPIDPEFKLSSEELDENIKLAFGVEGAVVRFDTGEMVKIKADEYVRKHRSKDLVSTQRGVLQLIIDKKLDDVIPQLDKDVADKLIKYQSDFMFAVGKLALALHHAVTTRNYWPQKEFALFVQKTFPRSEQSLYFNVRKGDNATDAILKKVAASLSTRSKAEEIVISLDLPKWTFSFFGEE